MKSNEAATSHGPSVVPFESYGRYYDLIYIGKDYAAEARYVADTLARFGCPSGNLLEFGSGTGRHARLLIENGYQVHGIERSPEMVAIALRAGCSASSSTVGDIRKVRLGRHFDAIIALFHVVSYLTTNDAIHEAFESAASHLGKGGVFLFDVWHGPAVLSQKPTVRVLRKEDAELRIVRIAEPTMDSTRDVVTVNYTLFVERKDTGNWSMLTESHPMRYLFPTEIEFVATTTGFEIACIEEFLTGAPASDRTWGVTYVLRKVK